MSPRSIAGGVLFYDSTRPLPASKLRDDVTVLGMPLTATLQRRILGRAAAPAIQEHHLSGGARGTSRYRCRRDREALCRAVQRQGGAARIESQGAAPRPRLCACELRLVRCRFGFAGRMRSAIASSSTATMRLRWVAFTVAPPFARGTRSRRHRRSPRHFRSIAANIASTRPRGGTSTRSCRPRTSSRRSAS